MSGDFVSMALSTTLAVVSGVIVFILGEIWKEYWLEPLHAYQSLRQRIAVSLTYYSNKYTSPVEISKTGDKLPKEYEEASTEFRQLACELRSLISRLPKWRPRTPKNDQIYQASMELIGLSNGMMKPYKMANDTNTRRMNKENVTAIREALKIKDLKN